MKKLGFLIVLPLLALAFCQKTAGEKSPVPRIELRSVTSERLVAGQDTLGIVLFYADGDGDLGENNPSVKNCFVQDSRDPSLRYEFRIKQLAPDGADIAIQGELEIVVPKTGLVSPTATTEKAVFSVKVIDRAGNESNEILTPEIEIVK